MNRRWRYGRASYRIPDEVIPTHEYEIVSLDSDRLVQTFCRTHHYLKTAGPPSRFRFGLYHHGELAGVAVFSHPTNDRTITNAFGCQATDGVELGRLVLLDEVPGNGESGFVGDCLRRLRKIGLAGVVTFSDPVPRWTSDGRLVRRGHVGCVFQALGATLAGRSTAQTLHMLPDGSVVSERTLQKLRAGEPGTRSVREAFESLGAHVPERPNADYVRRLLDQFTRPLRHPGNYRYLWALTRATKKHLPPSLPYPKLDPLFWAAEREMETTGPARWDAAPRPMNRVRRCVESGRQHRIEARRPELRCDSSVGRLSQASPRLTRSTSVRSSAGRKKGPSMRKRGMSSGCGDDDRREWIAFLARVPYLECGSADAHASARIRRCLRRFAPKLHRVEIRLQGCGSFRTPFTTVRLRDSFEKERCGRPPRNRAGSLWRQPIRPTALVKIRQVRN